MPGVTNIGQGGPPPRKQAPSATKNAWFRGSVKQSCGQTAGHLENVGYKVQAADEAEFGWPVVRGLICGPRNRYGQS